MSQLTPNSVTSLHNLNEILGVGSNLLTCGQVDILVIDPSTSKYTHMQSCVTKNI